MLFGIEINALNILAGIAPRIAAVAPYGGSFVAAGLFCWFFPEVVNL